MSKRIPIFLGLIIVFISVWALLTTNDFVHGLTERLNNIGYDMQLRTRILTENKEALLSPVVIVDIDDKSLKEIGRWPWSRDKLADLVNAMQKQGAAVIGFDMLFSEPELNIVQVMLDKLKTNTPLSSVCTGEVMDRQSFFDKDVIFARSLLNKNVDLGVSFVSRDVTSNQLSPPAMTLAADEYNNLDITEASGYISNIPILQNAVPGSGFINVFTDHDGIIRHAPLVMQYKKGVYTSLALEAALLYLDEKMKLVVRTYDLSKKLEGIKIGERFVPTNEKGEVLIPFMGKSFTFEYYSAVDVLKEKLPKNALSDKIVLVGTSATGLGDLKATAIENPYPGVEIQATIVNGILNSHFSYAPAWTLGANVFLAILFGLIASFTFPNAGPRLLGAIILLFPACLIFINNFLWVRTGLVLSLLIPIISVLMIAFINIIYGYLVESRRREEIKEMFGQYVPETHIDEMLKDKADYGMKGEDREMSVLFADIRNFTGLSENMPVPELVDMLNSFFTPMTEIIFTHQGTIDKYIGDLIMAFWGAPLRDDNHAYNVIQTALDMQARVKGMRQHFKEKNWPEISIGIGINSGFMAVGDMGSRFRRNYTVIGDAVNLASRLESLTKFYGVGIIVSEHTQHDQPDFVFRKLDKVQVKGKQEVIEIFEVICSREQLTPEVADELNQYQHAVDLYFKQQWDEAGVEINALHLKYPENKVYDIYLDRIKKSKGCPFIQDWDGVYTHETK